VKEVTKIVVNGQEYGSVDQMPPEIRERYLQAITAMRGAQVQSPPGPAPAKVVYEESIVFNGQKYNSIDELPPDVRQLIANIPPPKPGEPKTLLEIKTSKTFRPTTHISSGWTEDDDHRPVDDDPKVPWLLVRILAAVVVILLILLYLAGRKAP
jgi:hypothetical protein